MLFGTMKDTGAAEGERGKESKHENQNNKKKVLEGAKGQLQVDTRAVLSLYEMRERPGIQASVDLRRDDRFRIWRVSGEGVLVAFICGIKWWVALVILA